MKRFAFANHYWLIILLSPFFINTPALSQDWAGGTQLNPGDLAIVGFKRDGSDKFAFVVLGQTIATGTILRFTDEGWTDRTDDEWRLDGNSNEDDFMNWTVSTDLEPGTVVIIEDTEDIVIVRGGSSTRLTDALSGDDFDKLDGDGDQVLIYQLAANGDYHFITGYASNDDGGTDDTDWDDFTTWDRDKQKSSLPITGQNSGNGFPDVINGLTNGTNAIRFPDDTDGNDWDNGRYIGTTKATLSELLAALYDRDNNWELSQDDEFSIGEDEFIINARPTSADITLGDVQVTQNESVAFDLTNFVFSDTDNPNTDEGEELAHVTIETLPTEGQLYLDIDPFNDQLDPGEEIDDLDGDENVIIPIFIQVGFLKYTSSGTVDDSFTFSVNDGISDSNPTNTANIDVIPAATVVSILRNGDNPTNGGGTNDGSDAVSWNITFSVGVTGVASDNFTLQDAVAGGTPMITNVTGSGTDWQVTASIGTGQGTVSLDFTSQGSIPQTITNIGEAETIGEIFTIDRTAPQVLSLEHLDPNNVLVTFNEDMDATNAQIIDGRILLEYGATLTDFTINNLSLSGAELTITTNEDINATAADTDDIVVTAFAAVTDIAGNAMGSPNTTSFELDALAPTITGFDFVDDTHLKISFSEPINNETSVSEPETAGNYTINIDNSDPDALFNNGTLTISSATLEAGGDEVTLLIGGGGLIASLDDLDQIELTITVANLSDDFDNNVASSNPVIVFDEAQPNLDLMSVVNTTTLSLTFSEAIINEGPGAGTSDPENTSFYTLAIEEGDDTSFDEGTLTINSATLEAGNLNVTLDVEDMSVALDDGYQIRVSLTQSRFKDQFKNDLNTNTHTINWDEAPPFVESLTYVDPSNLLVKFNEDIKDEFGQGGNNIANFSLTGSTSGNLTISAADVQNGDEVLLTLASPLPQTNQDILITVTQSGIQDLVNNNLGLPNTASLSFDSADPDVTALEFVSDTELRVTFSEEMKGLSTFSDFAITDQTGNAATVTVSGSTPDAGNESTVLTVNSLDGEADLEHNDVLRVTVSNVTDLFDNALSTNTSDLTYDKQDPNVTGLVYIDDNTLQVTFDSEVTGSGIENVNEYELQFDVDNNGSYDDGPISIDAVSLAMDGLSATLTINAGLQAALANNNDLRITVDPDGGEVTDLFDNSLNIDQADLDDFRETAPTVTGLSYLTATTVNVAFNAELAATGAQTTSNYFLVETQTGALNISNAALQPSGTDVVLTFSGTINEGETVSVTVFQSGVTDLFGNSLGTPNTANFIFDETGPTIDNFEFLQNNGTSDTDLLITLSEEVSLNSPSITLDDNEGSTGAIIVNGASLTGGNKQVILNVEYLPNVTDLAPGDEMLLTIVSGVTDLSGNTPSPNTATLDFDSGQPSVTSLVYVDDTHIQVTFDEPLIGLEVIGEYDLEYDNGSNGFDGSFTIDAVVIAGDRQSATLEVSNGFSAQLDDLDDLRITVDPNDGGEVTDGFGNVLSTDQITLNDFDETPPTVTSVQYEDTDQLRLFFSEALDDNGQPDLVSNYTVQGLLNGVQTITSVMLEEPNDDEAVITLNDDLVNLFDDGEVIIVTVEKTTMTDAFWFNNLTTPNTASLTFEEISPNVISLEYVSDTELKITFDEPVFGTDLTDETQYSVVDQTPTVATINVAAVTPMVTNNNTVVTITVDDLTGITDLNSGDVIQVTVPSTLTDEFGNAIGTITATTTVDLDALDVTTLTFISDTELRVTFNDQIFGADVTNAAEYVLDIDDGDDNDFVDGTITVNSVVLDGGGNSVTLNVNSLIGNANLDGATDDIRVTVDGDMNADITDEFGNGLSTNIAELSDYDPVQPNVSGFAITDATTVVVTFDEDVDATLAGDPTNYSFDNSIDQPSAVVYSDGGGGGPYTATLTVDLSSLPESNTLQVTVANVTDHFDNPLNTASGTSAGYSDTSAPFLVDLIYITDTQIRAVFNEPMNQDANIVLATNYVLTDDNGGVTDPVVSSAIHANDGDDFVLLNMLVNDLSGHTENDQITLTINSSSMILDNASTPNTIANTNASFLIDTTDPTVQSLTRIADNQVSVKFSEPMFSTGAGNGAQAAANYTPLGVETDGMDNDFDEATIVVSSAVFGNDESEVILTLASNLSTLATGNEIRVTVSSVTDKAARSLSTNTAELTIDLDNVDVTALTILDDNNFIVAFNDDLDDVEATITSNYVLGIENVGGDDSFDDDFFTVTNAALNGQEITLTVSESISSTLDEGNKVEVDVDEANVIDDFGNPLNSDPNDKAEITYDETRPTVTGLEFLNDGQVRVTFSENMGTSAENEANYTLSGNINGSVAVSNATLSNDEVTLDVTSLSGDLDDGEILTVTASGVRDLQNNLITNPVAASFTYDENAPTITDFRFVQNNGTSDTDLLIEFSEEMTFNSEDFDLDDNTGVMSSLTVNSAVLSSDNTEVTLNVDYLTNVTDLDDLDDLLLTIVSGVTDLFGNTPNPNTATLQYDETLPNVTALQYVDDNTLTVTFDDTVIGSGVEDPNEYVLNYRTDGGAYDDGTLTVNDVVLANDALSATLTINSGLAAVLADDNDIEITVDSNDGGEITDDFGQLFADDNAELLDFRETAPTVTALQFEDATHVRVTFSARISSGASVTGNYILSGTLSGTHPVTGAIIQAGDLDVILEFTGPLTDGETVTVTVNQTNVTDQFNNNLQNPNTANFIYDVTLPDVTSLEFVDDTHLKVSFSEEITDLSTHTDFAFADQNIPNATITASASTPAADNLSTVITINSLKGEPNLTTENITVTVSNVTDLRGNALNNTMANLAYVTSDPNVDALTFVDDNTLRVDFSEAMSGPGIEDPNEYVLMYDSNNDGFNEGPIAIDAVELAGDKLSATLTINAGLSATLNNNDDLQIQVDANDDAVYEEDFHRNLQTDTRTILDFDEDAPFVTSLSFESDTELIIAFSENVSNATDEGDFAFIEGGPFPVSKQTPAVVNAHEVTVTFNSSIKGAAGTNHGDILSVSVSDANITDAFGNKLINPRSASITIDETQPSVTGISVSSLNELLISFDEDLRNNAGSSEPNNVANYSLQRDVDNDGFNDGFKIGFNITGATLQPSGDEVLLTLDQNLTAIVDDQDEIQVTVVAANVLDLFDNQLSVNTADLVFDGNPPTVIDMQYEDDTHVVINFSEPLKNGGGSTPQDLSHYELLTDIDNDGFDDGAIAINSATLFNSDQSVRLDVNSINAALTAADGGTLNNDGNNNDRLQIGVKASATIRDNADNSFTGPVSTNINYDVIGPSVFATLIFEDATNVRVIFNENDIDATSAVALANYTVTAGLGGSPNPSDATFFDDVAASIETVNAIHDEVVIEILNLNTVSDEADLTIEVTGVTDESVLANVVNPLVDEATLSYDGLAPTFVSGIVNNASPDLVVVNFSDILQTSGNVDDGFVISIDDGMTISTPIIEVATFNGIQDQITFDIDQNVQAGELVSVAFTDGSADLKDDFLNQMADFDQSVVNNVFGPASALTTNCLIDGVNLTWTKPPGLLAPRGMVF
ncbi:MAG: Ig-like domain-containing protein [Cyclobacteriaceae bacterium]